MKLTTGILAISMTMMAGFSAQALAQNTDAIDNARSVAKSLQQKQDNDSNAALNAAGTPSATTTASKPAPGAPAPAVKPAVIPGAKPAAVASTPAPKPVAAKPAAVKPVSSAHNQLQKVNVVQGGDSVKIEISSSQAVTGQVYKMKSPARVVVELPETVVASSENKIAVNSAGVKGVRIGMDGKTPPTTSVVVDLENALAYELTPGPADKLILTLHTQGGVPVVAKSTPAANPAAGNSAKSTPAAVKTPAAQPQTVAKNAAPATAPAAKASTATVPAAKSPVPPAPVATAKAQPASGKVQVGKAVAVAATTAAVTKAAPDKKADAKTPQSKALEKDKQQVAKDTKIAVPAATASAPAAALADPFKATADASKPKAEDKKEDKKWAMSGKRDPFFSPVVQQGGSGCSTGKKCLEIGNINLRGVVKSDTGFIAVVTNNMNKAYFLRENDPVFNGYVVKITGDSIVFQETVEDKLGKPFTREVTKRIFTPAV